MVNYDFISRSDARVLEERLNLIGKPANDRIVILVSNPKTNSGIIIPELAKNNVPKKGVVVQIGSMADDNPFLGTLKIGDIINYGEYAGKEIELSDEKPIPFYNPDTEKLVILSLMEIIYIENNKEYYER